MKNIHNILDKSGLSPSEINVYLSLLEGAESVKEIIKVTAEKRPTVYYALSNLLDKGLVSKTGKDYGNMYQVEPIEKLKTFIEEKIIKQKELLVDIEAFSESYSKKKTKKKVHVSYFDTLPAIRSAIMSSVYIKNKNIYSIVPAENFFVEMGDEFRSDYIKEKNLHEVKTRALWEDIPNLKKTENIYEGFSIRQLPVSMHNEFHTTVFIYDDNTLYISPIKESFAVLIKSEEHSKLMRAVFEAIWQNATNVKS